MSIYKVHFKWKDKEIELSARSLDMTHPYFVSIKDLVFSSEKKIIINPLEDEVRKTFMQAEHLMLPFQSVLLIEEISEGRKGVQKVMPFSLLPNEQTLEADSADAEELQDLEEEPPENQETEAGPARYPKNGGNKGLD